MLNNFGISKTMLGLKTLWRKIRFICWICTKVCQMKISYCWICSMLKKSRHSRSSTYPTSVDDKSPVMLIAKSVHKALNCYRESYKEKMHWTQQTPLDVFFLATRAELQHIWGWWWHGRRWWWCMGLSLSFPVTPFCHHPSVTAISCINQQHLWWIKLFFFFCAPAIICGK